MTEPSEERETQREIKSAWSLVEHHMLWFVLAVIGLLFLWHALVVPPGSEQGTTNAMIVPEPSEFVRSF